MLKKMFVVFYISLSGLSKYGFSACMEQTRKFISDSKVHKPGKTTAASINY